MNHECLLLKQNLHDKIDEVSTMTATNTTRLIHLEKTMEHIERIYERLTTLDIEVALASGKATAYYRATMVLIAMMGSLGALATFIQFLD